MACLLPASPASAAGRGLQRPAPSAEQLQEQANAAAARFSEAQSVYGRLQDDIARLERQVSAAETRMGVLRKAVTRRTTAAYKGSSALTLLGDFGGGGDLLQSARATRLAVQVSAADVAALKELTGATAQLRQRRQSLADQRDAQKKTLEQIDSERRKVERQLAAMARARKAAEARQAAAAARAARASRSKAAAPAPAAVVAVPPVTPGAFVCPIRGPLAFSRDFGQPRGGGRRHAGNDLMNPKGTENVAVVAGTIESRYWGGGGLTIFLTGDDGHTYVYMHLMRLAGAMPRRVVQGEVIGYTGATGNASAYHTHFEYHPGGGAAVDPYPLISAHC